jgi:phage shock protein E
MMKFGSLFSVGKKTKEQEAKVIDVRTPGEFEGGHYAGSENIPLDRISSELDRIKEMDQPLILVCKSGARSGQATSFLKQHGIEAKNGGSWNSL